MTDGTDDASERERMVRAHLAARGIADPRVLDAFRAVPREFAYQDSPLPIEQGQTISQLYIVALIGARGGHRLRLRRGAARAAGRAR